MRGTALGDNRVVLVVVPAVEQPAVRSCTNWNFGCLLVERPRRLIGIHSDKENRRRASCMAVSGLEVGRLER